MSSIANLLQIARSALLSHQQAMSVVAHNIANVNTEGYSRQRINFATELPIQSGKATFGSGVKVENVNRYQAEFVTKELYNRYTELGKWEYMDSELSNIETLFGKIGESDISVQLNDFFSAWEELTIDPENTSYRRDITHKGFLLTSQMNAIAESLENLYNNTDSLISNIVTQINQYSAELADLNQKIFTSENNQDQKANDLRDRRDLLLKKVSQLTNISYYEDSSGMMNVIFEGIQLVSGVNYYNLETTSVMTENRRFTEIRLNGSSSTFQPKTGKLAGVINLRDDKIKNYIDMMNEIASKLVTEVNALHKKGFDLNGDTGINFFDSAKTTALNITLNSEIVNDLTKIAAAGGKDNNGDGEWDESLGSGDNTIALQIANLANEKLFEDVNLFDQVYALYSQVGFDTQQANNMLESTNLLIQQLENTRESKVGVSLDEEMANMIQLQNSYMAASKLIDTVNSMIQTLLDII
jgi:flagellar hook-associated protein 1 FlgK